MASVCGTQVRGHVGHTFLGVDSLPTDMDLCCLIDSDERLAASDLVTMLGDLLARGKLHLLLSPRDSHKLYIRNEIRHQAVAPRKDTHREAVASTVAWLAFRYSLRHRLRKSTSARKHAIIVLLCHDRSRSCEDHGPLPYVFPPPSFQRPQLTSPAVKVWCKRRYACQLVKIPRHVERHLGKSIPRTRAPCHLMDTFCL